MNKMNALKVINPSTATLLDELPVDDLDSAVAKLDSAYKLFGDKARHLPLNYAPARDGMKRTRGA